MSADPELVQFVGPQGEHFFPGYEPIDVTSTEDLSSELQAQLARMTGFRDESPSEAIQRLRVRRFGQRALTVGNAEHSLHCVHFIPDCPADYRRWEQEAKETGTLMYHPV